MPDYRRARIAGGTYFFTLVTFDRRPILTNELGLRCLRTAWSRVRDLRPFRTVAVCVLPDHLHCIWSLPGGDDDYSRRWGAIKSLFSKAYLALDRGVDFPNASRRARGETAIWQRRFWEHAIRDERDLRRHVDYIHYNPVKHGYVYRPLDWRWSSFRRFVRDGWYEPRWGEREPADVDLARTVGE